MENQTVTITVKRETRDRLIRAKGMGYTYDRFFSDLMNLYEKEKGFDLRAHPAATRGTGNHE